MSTEARSAADEAVLDALQDAKAVVRSFHDDLDEALRHREKDLRAVLHRHLTSDVHWRGLRPFGEQHGPDAVADVWWEPLVESFAPLQRRADVFLAGETDAHGDGFDSTEEGDVWVAEMGHFLGLFDQPWLGIPPTHRMCFHRYAQFHRVRPAEAVGPGQPRIAESAMFCDVLSIMQQAGVDPLPPQTGSAHVHPGPMTHDGLLFDAQEPSEGHTTMALVNAMVQRLSDANETALATGDDRMPREALAEHWHDDMIWSGPAGIGATYTIARYQQQHQYPFRFGLGDKTFNGHVARFAEGEYACFFGWPNLSNRAIGGFLGLPAGAEPADMYVVDVYRRAGDKLAENWVFIDILGWLEQQGLDVLARMRQLTGQEQL